MCVCVCVCVSLVQELQQVEVGVGVLGEVVEEGQALLRNLKNSHRLKHIQLSVTLAYRTTLFGLFSNRHLN